MGVTTRGGKARTLEYDKHEDLITKEESLKRVDILLIILTFILNFSSLFCILIYVMIHSEKFHSETNISYPIVPSMSLYLLLISHNFEVFIQEIFLDQMSVIKIRSGRNDEPLLRLTQFDYIHSYVYNQELYLIYGNRNKKFMYLQKAFDRKTLKKYFSGEIYEEYVFSLPPSFVQFGSHIWLYGKLITFI